MLKASVVPKASPPLPASPARKHSLFPGSSPPGISPREVPPPEKPARFRRFQSPESEHKYFFRPFKKCPAISYICSPLLSQFCRHLGSINISLVLCHRKMPRWNLRFCNRSHRGNFFTFFPERQSPEHRYWFPIPLLPDPAAPDKKLSVPHPLRSESWSHDKND